MNGYAFIFASVLSIAASSPEPFFSQSDNEIDAYDFVEVTINVKNPIAVNPFTEVAVDGEFKSENGNPVHVDGFCDSQDGSIFRIRFMPAKPGKYDYSVSLQQDESQIKHRGSFTARDGKRRGIVRVDPDHPWHFVWEGTGEHYFWNSTTTY